MVLAAGARGDLVWKAQERLTEQGFDPNGVDGKFGGGTVRAVRAFRLAKRLEPGEELDAVTWRRLTGERVPPIRDRVLQLTAAWEGHGFTLAEGNYDGAGITWGIIGFTLQHGEIPAIVLDCDRTHPELVREAFGGKTDELLRMMRAPWSQQRPWADALSRGPSKQHLVEPWARCFRRFGELPEVRRLQLDRAESGYYQPARDIARDLGLTTELGLALCFDVRVQNGSITRRARAEIERETAARPPRRERDLRVIVANAVANASKPEWREVVRSRKITLAMGAGTVYGGRYELKSWGLMARRVRL